MSDLKSEEQLLVEDTIKNLKEKYSKYNDRYECALSNEERSKEDDYLGYPGGHPCLYDALLTECHLPFAVSTFSIYNQEVENDIKTIVKLVPETLTCKIGELRCRECVTPLAAACFNKVIPLHIIEFLVQNGANIDDKYLLCNNEITVLEDFKKNEPKRYSEIERIFTTEKRVMELKNKITLLTKENEELKRVFS